MSRKALIYVWTTLLMLILCTSLASAQTPTAMIKIEGYSFNEIHDLGWASPRSTGLSNVGVGQLVYLIGSDSLNAAVTSYAWTLFSRPAGSAAVLDSSATKQITFKPDVEGKFAVRLVITTAGGTSAPKSITINAAKFVGVGGMDGLPSDPSQGQCSLCHSTNFNEWKLTGHADMFTRGIDGIVSTHYGEACIECHTVGYDPEPTAVNDGFDDVQTELGWVFPDTLRAGNWNALKTNFQKLAHRGNIQCENCHGPGSLHKGDKAGIAMSLDEAVCGYCHEEEPYHRKSVQWKESAHGVGIASAAGRAGCADCHSGWGVIRRLDPIANDKRPSLGAPQTSCAVCHNPHSVEWEHQLRTLSDITLLDSVTVINYGGAGKLCMQCHHARRDAVDYASNAANLSTHFGPHYSSQADMLAGANAIDYGIPIGSSGHKFAAAEACVTCHMQTTPASGQPGRDKVGEHTFAMHYDNETPDDPSDDVEHVAICQTCHGPITSFDDIMAKADYDEDGTIEGTRHEVEGLLEKLDSLLPPRGPTTTIVKNNFDWTLPGLSPAEVARRKALTKAWYNYRFVEEDGSHGVHNAGYAISLLRRSIASITTGDVGAAEIISITDVPNDQGKQVRVAWSKFPGDGISANPIISYSLWRKVDEAAGSAVVQVPSKAAMFSQAVLNNVGKRFAVAQEGSWDFVAWLPAAAHETYSIVAPTLYDSTAAGIHWSYFFVSGQAEGQVYETAPDSGYSVDNLAPSAPSSATASIVANKVNLHWDDPIDADFKYFAIYRGSSSGFDPKSATPIATLIGTDYTDSDVVVGSKYYYRLSAFDFSGNESPYSPELEALITSVDERAAVPTEYALLQNYPNPFNPGTSIKYQLPVAGHVRLSIYTVLGQEVRRLIDRSQAAAYHVVAWDGRDNAGNTLPSGVYFYRLESGGFTAMKKMIMMK